MTDPITTTVATALATKAVAGLTEAGKRSFQALMKLVRRKLEKSPQSRKVLASAQSCPNSEVYLRALAETLAQATANDRYFSEQVAILWRRVEEGRISVAQGSALNMVSGNVEGAVVQARDIYGNVSLG